MFIWKKKDKERPKGADEIKISSEFSNYDKDFSTKKSFLAKLKKSLSKTRNIFNKDLDLLFKGKIYVDHEIIEGLEEFLITSDVGIETTMNLIEKISMRKSSIFNSNDLRKILREEVIQYFNMQNTLFECEVIPKVTMVVGTNGVGKTTTIGKLANMKSSKGKKVLIAAADTFRAAAIEQLSVYAHKAGADIIKHKYSSDPAAVVYDSVSAAVSRKIDEVLIDTAGRVNTKINLMKELEKISRSASKSFSGAPHEILLVLDATTGQNAISQTKKFNDFLNITGIVLTKLDSNSKGGVIIDIAKKFNIAIKYVCFGEKMGDIQKFDPETFTNTMI